MKKHDHTTNNPVRQFMQRAAKAAPLLTLLVAFVAIALGFLPGCEVTMSYDRDAIARGQVWRLITGHPNALQC